MKEPTTSDRSPTARATDTTMPTARPPLPVLDFSRIGPAVGERFPDIVLPDQHGRTVDLHAARAGRRAIVVFHRSASW